MSESLPNEEPKRSWHGLLAVGLVGIVVVAAIAWQLSRRPPPDFLAAQVKPQILKEWQKHPVLRKLTIQNITLEHKTGNEYTGWIECSLGGHTTRVGIDVTVKEDSKVAWKIQSRENGLPVKEMYFNGAQVFVAFSVTDDEAK